MSHKAQHILVIIQDNNHIKKASNHAFKLAKIFKAEVAFTYLQNQHSLQKLPVSTINEINHDNIAYKEFQFGNSTDEPNNAIKQLEAIFIVTEFSVKKLGIFKRNKIFDYLYNARIPSILISDCTDYNVDYKNIIVPVDFKRETKEKMIWASYFGRFNKSIIHLFVANHKSVPIQSKIKATLIFTKRMYDQFNCDFKIIKSERSSNWLRQDAFIFSEQFNCDLILLLSQKNDNLLNRYFGSSEIKKYLRNKKNPILFINPLKDYYLPCN